VGEARKILRKIKPDVIFSKGGFVAYPVVRAGARLGIPVVAHESDMTLGLSNRISVKYCTKICTTFAKTAGNGGRDKCEKFLHTGSPIRPRIYNGKREIVTKRHFLNGAGVSSRGGNGQKTSGADMKNSREKDKLNLLVLGGSLGAVRINTAVIDALPGLAGDYNIIHICGRGKTGNASGQTGGYARVEFAEDIENYLDWADLVVSRAGSNALCELMVLGKPTLFIPLSAGRGDQIDNAKEVLRCNAGKVLYEEDLTPDALVRNINAVRDGRVLFSKNARKAVAAGNDNIFNTICGVLSHT
jgi:UDP-N-acetylglucosamine--N-acetylmuramyl-(pentapeptide) pyrophosphoryl-undecaprenol N-acetylglucosamine transferase